MALQQNDIRNQFVFVSTGNPETVNDATPYAAGQVGALFTRGSETFQYVKFDTGATTAAAVAVAADEIVFWKDRDDFLVTTVANQAAAGRNAVAGVLKYALTPGYHGFIQTGGLSAIKTAGSPAIGDIAVANSGSDADVTPIGIGTAPTHRAVGVYQSTASGGVATVNLLLNENV